MGVTDGMAAGMVFLSRGLSFLAGPAGWALLSGWTVWDIMGPAYPVTVPAVLQTAYLRAEYQASHSEN